MESYQYILPTQVREYLKYNQVNQIQLKDGTIVQITDYIQEQKQNQPIIQTGSKLEENIETEEGHNHHKDGIGYFGQHYKTQYSNLCEDCASSGVIKKRQNYVLYVSKNCTERDVALKHKKRKEAAKSEIKEQEQIQEHIQEQIKEEINEKIKEQIQEHINEQIKEHIEEQIQEHIQEKINEKIKEHLQEQIEEQKLENNNQEVIQENEQIKEENNIENNQYENNQEQQVEEEKRKKLEEEEKLKMEEEKKRHDERERLNQEIDPYVPIDTICPLHSKNPLSLFCLEEKGN